jgi:uncharacterized protein (DUF302 family)
MQNQKFTLMKKLLILVLLLEGSCHSKNNQPSEAPGAATVAANEASNWITKASPFDANATMNKLKTTAEAMGFTLVAHIDHSAAAAKHDLNLAPTQVLIFGNPEVGTLLMQEDPRVGLDLPLKVVVWESEGKTFIGYRDPAHLLTDYKIENQRAIIEKMQGALQKITDQVVQE